MNKAEQFIKDYTRGCSNELCAVEDIHGKKVISYHEWLTPEQALAAVAYAREEMIDKACEWLADNYSNYIVTNGLAAIFSATIDFDTIKMIEEFKNAMEG